MSASGRPDTIANEVEAEHNIVDSDSNFPEADFLKEHHKLLRLLKYRPSELSKVADELFIGFLRGDMSLLEKKDQLNKICIENLKIQILKLKSIQRRASEPSITISNSPAKLFEFKKESLNKTDSQSTLLEDHFLRKDYGFLKILKICQPKLLKVGDVCDIESLMMDIRILELEVEINNLDIKKLAAQVSDLKKARNIREELDLGRRGSESSIAGLFGSVISLRRVAPPMDASDAQIVKEIRDEIDEGDDHLKVFSFDRMY